MKGKQFLMLPGPTPVPQEVLQALARPMINHRGPEFKALLDEAVEGLKEVFCTRQEVLILTGAGTGAMEAAVSNFVSPGDRVLVVSIGSFGDRFAQISQKFGAQVDNWSLPGAPRPIRPPCRTASRQMSTRKSGRCSSPTTRPPPVSPTTFRRCGQQ